MESCPICNETKKPFHCHYGATCCLKCRAFFRRVIQTNGTTNLENVFSCTSITQHNNCDMQKFGITHKCPRCRLMRCLEIGMRPDKVVLDEETRTKFTGKVSFFTDFRSYSKLLSFFRVQEKKKLYLATSERFKTTTDSFGCRDWSWILFKRKALLEQR